MIINDEPIHLKMLQKVLKEEGIRLTTKDYYKNYLAFDDKNCFEKILEKENCSRASLKIQELIQRKATYYETFIEKKHRVLFPGVKKWVHRLSKLYPLAIASAALGNEIRWILKRANLLSHFQVIISAEDTPKSKPNPESYLKALQRLNRRRKILPQECLVIEDSIAGIKGAHQASMKCVALAHTYTRTQLKEADLVFTRFKDFSLRKIKALFKPEK
ncbi:MAG: HAD family phosphatase [Chlamydiae bacterium]|nr:HAD family phosphatase [Chlamydiota bacterium]